jgi:superfamily I DNA/RNA helicase
MSIDRFDTQRFEAALPRKKSGDTLWDFAGMVDGERMYVVYAGPFARVVVRSSIDESGYAAEAGEDSIRLWLEIMTSAGQFRGVKKLDSWTTRVNGWEDRMVDKMRELYRYGIKVKRTIPAGCQFWFVKKGPNEGRPCAKNIQAKKDFVWMDEPEFDTPEPESDPFSTVMKAVEDKVSDATEPEEELASKSENANEDAMSILDELNALANDEFEKAPAEDEKKPSKQQAAAIYAPTDVPIRMIASAGSGKTFTLKWRYRQLLDVGFKPENIVVVTFTKDMSTDMANQIIALNPEIAGTPGETQICSIHAFCNRVLSAEGIGLRIPDKSWEVKSMLREFAKDLWPYSNESDPSTCRPTWEELLSVISNAKHRAYKIGQDYAWYEAMWGGYHAERLARCREMFDRKMRGNKWWTFADMLFEMEIRLNEDNDFRERCQGRFQYLMIDEGQDTNGQAMRILTTVAAPKNQIFVVGDPDQLLFRFTGATPEMNLYDGFTERYPNGLTYFLETNYRSTHTIVNKSNDLISYNYQGLGGPYDEVYHKTCMAREDAGEGAEIMFDWYDDAQYEAVNVAMSIAEQINNGAEPGSIFVASRTRAQLGQLEPPLTSLGIPFINITGGSFWMLRHVKHILSYLRLAMDNNDSDSFRHIYNIASNNMLDRYGEYCPTRWLGNSFLRAMDRTYDSDRAAKAAWNYSGWAAGIKDLTWMMNNIEDMVSKIGKPIDEGGMLPRFIVRWIIENSVAKYLKHEEGVGDNDDIGKLADLEVVYDVAGQFDTLEDFFGRIDEAIQAAKDAKSKNWEKYVVLSTVHRLKGMERPTVYGIGWCEGEKVTDSFTSPVGLLPHTFSLIEPPANGVLNFGGKSPIEDERCIAYVLITRAQEQVFLSGFQNHRGALMWPSRFITELDLK